MISCLLSRLVSIWEKEDLNFMSSSAVWSVRVEMIRLPWLLKLAVTTFMCFAWGFWVREALILLTI